MTVNLDKKKHASNSLEHITALFVRNVLSTNNYVLLNFSSAGKICAKKKLMLLYACFSKLPNVIDLLSFKIKKAILTLESQFKTVPIDELQGIHNYCYRNFTKKLRLKSKTTQKIIIDKLTPKFSEEHFK